MSKDYLINEKIKAREVRLIDEDGQQKGILPTTEALFFSEEKGLDLVMISPNTDPPVCKIMDFGKFKYEQDKKEKDAKKLGKANQQEIKEIKLTPRIEKHDYEFKVNHAKYFLAKGHKVKFSIVFKGRELSHPELGDKLVEKIKQDIEGLAKLENEPKLLRKMITIIVAPTK